MDGAQPSGLVRAVGVTQGWVAWIGHAADVLPVGAGKTWNIGGKGSDAGPGRSAHPHRLWREKGCRFRGAVGRRMRGDLEGCLIKEQWANFENCLMRRSGASL